MTPSTTNDGAPIAASVEADALDLERPFVLGAENRFPLDLTARVQSQWAAYEAALEQAWDPEDDRFWDGFDPSRFTESDRQAAALVWSHRAWVEYPMIAESEAVLVRACLEPDVAIDFKYCLSMRAVERARSADLAHLVAKCLGRYLPSPSGPELKALLDGELVRRALHAHTDLDAYVAAHLVAQATIDLAMWSAAGENASPSIAAPTALVTRDKSRMLDVAWDWIADRISRRDDADRPVIGRAVSAVLQSEEQRGRQVPALLGPCKDRDDLMAAHELAAAAGLGGVSAETQQQLAAAAMTAAAARFGELGVEVAVAP